MLEMRREMDTSMERTLPVDLDAVAKLASLAIDLDAVVEVLLEGSTVEDTVTRGARVVNDELVLGSSLCGGLDLVGGGGETQHKPTEKITQQSDSGH